MREIIAHATTIAEILIRPYRAGILHGPRLPWGSASASARTCGRRSSARLAPRPFRSRRGCGAAAPPPLPQRRVPGLRRRAAASLHALHALAFRRARRKHAGRERRLAAWLRRAGELIDDNLFEPTRRRLCRALEDGAFPPSVASMSR